MRTTNIFEIIISPFVVGSFVFSFGSLDKSNIINSYVPDRISALSFRQKNSDAHNLVSFAVTKKKRREKKKNVAKESFFFVGWNSCMGVRTISRSITDTANIQTGSTH